jgi:hypothetical protein
MQPCEHLAAPHAFPFHDEEIRNPSRDRRADARKTRGVGIDSSSYFQLACHFSKFRLAHFDLTPQFFINLNRERILWLFIGSRFGFARTRSTAAGKHDSHRDE